MGTDDHTRVVLWLDWCGCTSSPPVLEVLLASAPPGLARVLRNEKKDQIFHFIPFWLSFLWGQYWLVKQNWLCYFLLISSQNSQLMAFIK